MDIVQDLGIQSYCFRGFKQNGKVIELVKECGLSAIELWEGHADFTDESGFDEIIETYNRGGVDIISIGTQTFSNDEAKETKFFEFAKKAGAVSITASFTVDSVPESFKTAEKLAEKYGIRVGIHNHGGRHWLGSRQMLRDVLANTNEWIGICLDTAWALDSHEDPVAMAVEFADRLYGVHLKDFVFDRAGRPEDVVVGQGNLDLPRIVEVLRQAEFNGAIVLEYEGDVEDPVPAMKQCVVAVGEAA